MSSPDKSEPWRNGWRVEYAARSLSHPPLPPCFPIGISASRPNAFNFKARNLKSELPHTPTLTALDSHRPAGSHHITRRIFSLIMEPRHWRHLCKPPGTLCGAVRFLRLPTRRPCYICTYVLAAAWPLYDSESPHLRLRAALDRVGFRSYWSCLQLEISRRLSSSSSFPTFHLLQSCFAAAHIYIYHILPPSRLNTDHHHGAEMNATYLLFAGLRWLQKPGAEVGKGSATGVTSAIG